MKDVIFSILQRVGCSFILPIAILPVAGLLSGQHFVNKKKQLFLKIEK